LNNDCKEDLSLILSGPVTVDRSEPSDDSNRFPGLRDEDGHLDVIDTEILSMSLTGSGYILVAGAGHGHGGDLDHSYGATAELPDSSLRDSFFDVFFEIEMPDGMPLYNHESVRIATIIDRVPPFGATYIKPTELCLPLYTGTGVHVANLVEAEHNIPAEVLQCLYIVGDCNHDGTALELADVIAMLDYYSGQQTPPYTCPCPPNGATFTPDADPNSDCTANGLMDVVAEIEFYRGSQTPGTGCVDCPGQRRLLPGGDEPLVIPHLKSKTKKGKTAE
jgi:hypothetical protein